MNIVIAILMFGIIIIVHELGHFLIAKKNGIQVDEFCIGLGPTIIGKQVGETFYSIKLLPFGGACMMGEDEERKDPNAFNNKSVWARIAVIFCGPLFNFIFAFFMAIIMIGMSGADLPDIGSVTKGTPAAQAGLKAGDVMTKVEGHKIHNYREFSYYMSLDYKKGETVNVTIERDGKEQDVTLTPEYNKKQQRYLVGFNWSAKQAVGPLKTIEYGVREVGLQVKITMKSLKMLVTREISYKELSGPVGIVKVVGDQYNEAAAHGLKVVILTMLNLAILISANLGVMNLLPIPALDGGRLVFLIIEVIRGKGISPDLEARIHTYGLFALLALMVFIMYQDIAKIFF